MADGTPSIRRTQASSLPETKTLRLHVRVEFPSSVEIYRKTFPARNLSSHSLLEFSDSRCPSKLPISHSNFQVSVALVLVLAASADMWAASTAQRGENETQKSWKATIKERKSLGWDFTALLQPPRMANPENWGKLHNPLFGNTPEDGENLLKKLTPEIRKWGYVFSKSPVSGFAMRGGFPQPVRKK